MVEGKGNRSNCKTWILALREALCARPVAMDGSDFGKFNTPLAHKQKTRKINLGRTGGSREPSCGFLLGWRRASLSLDTGPGLGGYQGWVRLLGATDHWAGQLQEAAATPLRWTLGGRRGHRDSGQEWDGAAGQEQGWCHHSSPQATAERGQQQIALCHSF